MTLHQLTAGLLADGAFGRSFAADDRGAVAIEYALIAALVVVVIVAALMALRTSLISLPFPALIAAFEEALA